MTSARPHDLPGLLGIEWPIIQAPMAGVSSPALAAAVSEAGGLGSLGAGASDAAGTRAMIGAVRQRTRHPFNVNLFCHRPAQADAAREAAWIERLRPQFAQFGASPPPRLREVYKSFVEDDAMLAMLLEEKPAVVSFHFGLPPEARVRALREAGIILLASATSLAEARMAAAAGMHAIVAQGYEAGGHRGIFDPEAGDERLGTLALTRILARGLDLPVIAAGGIMDGAGIAAVLRLGAGAAQLGTAFIACPESLADDAYRAALASEAAHHTTVTPGISGRPARCLDNRFTAMLADVPDREIPAYPIAYDAGKALNQAARAAGEAGFGAQWAGQGAPLARALPAAELMAALIAEMRGG
ncbi:NAD(P)H-dependent flavin oxidoreductase [Roseomonas marmotae]|uniref:Propionate 3-nitronate monooxygenase n=1 Tax=Roseomonas marmotae TaxID=2768161 RepID=A0ABS3K729_9PROT|nr:nitronate monooxygenase [Roseomonas marmotae]MBO1073253.1 nitronate monooxygenase [Roseomonas marmotae]QTI79123.1 nitronate monooxygenase [Roseomonas marmotae]